MSFLMSLVYMGFGIGMLVGIIPVLIRHTVPGAIVSGGSVLSLIGLASGLLGALVYFSCGFDFATRGKGTPAFWDPPKSFIQNVWFRSVRNPMYIGVGMMIVGQAIWFGSIWLGLYAIVVTLGFHLFVVVYEEPHLTTKYGFVYKNYCRNVPRWIPRRPTHLITKAP